MQLDSTLNVVWVLLGVLAIGVTLAASARQPGTRRWRLAGIVLVLAALFPFVSATDDILRVEHYATEHDAAQRGPHHPQQQQRTTSSDDLIRLYEAMDAPLAPDVVLLAFVLLFVSFITLFGSAVLTRVAPRESGRSPPASFIAA